MTEKIIDLTITESQAALTTGDSNTAIFFILLTFMITLALTSTLISATLETLERIIQHFL